MAAASELLHVSSTLEVTRVVLSLGQLAAIDVRPLPTMLIDAGNLNFNQLAILTNTRVQPIMDSEREGRTSANSRPADVIVAGKPHSLVSDLEMIRTAASLLPIERRAEVQAATKLPDTLFDGTTSVADVHRSSLHHLHLPASRSRTVSGLMTLLGQQGAKLMENLDAQDLLGEAVATNGYVTWIDGYAIAPGYLRHDPKESSIFGFGRNPRQGIIPSPMGIIAMQSLFNHQRGHNEITAVADAHLMDYFVRNEGESVNLDRALHGTLGPKVLSKITLIDISGIDTVIGGSHNPNTQYDLIVDNPDQDARRVSIPGDQFETPLTAGT